ncbi:MAG: hypothetical protein HON94_15650 [Methylococcales bacterium]|jgi:hypothetical protein|nr:hypothetical protein [Methylococcales bacterium]
MLKFIGLVVVIGSIFLFLNWEEYGHYVQDSVVKVNEAAQGSEKLRSEIKEKIKETMEK